MPEHHHGKSVEPVDYVDGRPVWLCSACGQRVAATFAYYGEWSCERCNWRALQWVACSLACSQRLVTK